MSRTGIVGLLLMIAIVGFVAYGSMSAAGHTCEVCMQYKGRSQCRKVAAATVDLAREGAIQNACAYIAGGVNEGMACHREAPVSEKCE